MSFIDSSVLADGSVVLEGVTEYWTNYNTNEIVIEWEATVKDEKIVSLDCRVVSGFDPVPETAVHFEIREWIREQREDKFDETAHYRSVA